MATQCIVLAAQFVDMHLIFWSCVCDVCRKLVIGCGFLTPDAKDSEAYVSFLVVHPDWRGVGIGRFMLYHLIQVHALV